MNLAEKMAQVSENKDAQLHEVANEIIAYFKEAFESGRFENNLEAWIKKDKNAQIKREYRVPVEFWDYNSGCSDTNFHVFNIFWYHPDGLHCYESRKYKGVDIIDVQHIVGNSLLNLTDYHLKEMGFRTRVENCESWLKYFHKEIVISW